MHARNFRHFDFVMVVLSYCPLKTVNDRSYKFSRILTLTEVYKHLKVAHARNFLHFDYFMVLSYCPLKTVQ